MLGAITTGLLFGLSAGIAPGPLMTLVLAQALRFGPAEGCKTALAPLITDAPIILLAVLVAKQASELQWILGSISIAGSLFVVYLAYEAWRPTCVEPATTEVRARSWLKGAVTNALNPHPWLFWMTVGSATLAKAVKESGLAVAAFLGSFYLLLVGSKLILAIAAGRSRKFLAGRPYRFIMRTLGVLLVAFAMLLFYDGFTRFQ